MTEYSSLLATLAQHRGVLGALLVSECDGLVVDVAGRLAPRSDEVAALASALVGRARLATHAIGHGPLRFFHLDAEQGRLCAVGAGDLLLVTVSEHRANLGLLRVTMLRAVESLA